MGITFAKWRWIVPLRGMSRNTADNNFTDEFVAFVTEEAQGFTCLVTVLVQGLVAIIGNTRVWARIIFHWQEKSNFKNQKAERWKVGSSAGEGLTDTFWTAVTPFGGSGVSSMAGDLTGSFQLVTLVAGETHQRSDSKAGFRTHRARAIHHLPRIRTLLDCEDHDYCHSSKRWGFWNLTWLSIAFLKQKYKYAANNRKIDRRVVNISHCTSHINRMSKFIIIRQSRLSVRVQL